MATKKELGRDSKGRYFRNLGWKKTEKGYAQQKFYLGRDESKAKLANLRLEQLWQQITRIWERDIGSPPANEKNIPPPTFVSFPGEPAPGNAATGKHLQSCRYLLDFARVTWIGDRPVWDEVTLTIADAVRNGEPVARIPLPSRSCSAAARTSSGLGLARPSAKRHQRDQDRTPGRGGPARCPSSRFSSTVSGWSKRAAACC